MNTLIPQSGKALCNSNPMSDMIPAEIPPLPIVKYPYSSIYPRQVLCELFRYLPKGFEAALTLKQVQAINGAFEKYQMNEEGKMYLALISLIAHPKLPTSYLLTHCDKWLRINAYGLRNPKNFGRIVKILAAVYLLKRPALDSDIRRVTGIKYSLFIDRNRLLKSRMFVKRDNNKTTGCSISKQGIKLLKLVLEAKEIRENNISLLVNS